MATLSIGIYSKLGLLKNEVNKVYTVMDREKGFHKNTGKYN